jgi:predicted nucleic acid-binding protein
MILLDTNYLIEILVPDSPEAAKIRAWYQEEELCTSAVAWYEFLCGPIDDDGILAVQALLRDRILPFTQDQAAESARLYNLIGRIRRLRVDTMIAAAAIVSNAELATGNQADFSFFESIGLRFKS